MDYSDIIDVTTDLFGKQLSKQSITNITDKFLVNVEEFKKRQLKKEYKVVYLDATFLSIKRGTYSKEAVYIALGISLEGNKEVLAFDINPNESANKLRWNTSRYKESWCWERRTFCYWWISRN
ncbi:transposase [Mycoplasma aquilae ATCC BAA-1896]|uniref:transposase n=1 Tax=Mycoplasma aquilae TaxID=1312741 RepID=UPI003A8C31CF